MKGKFESMIVAGTFMLIAGLPAAAPAGPGGMGGGHRLQGQVRMMDTAGAGRMQMRGINSGPGNGMGSMKMEPNDTMPSNGGGVHSGDAAGRPEAPGASMKESGHTRGGDAYLQGTQREKMKERLPDSGEAAVASDAETAQSKGYGHGPGRTTFDAGGGEGNPDIGGLSGR